MPPRDLAALSLSYGPAPATSEMIALLRTAVDRGVNFFDTAEVWVPLDAMNPAGAATASFDFSRPDRADADALTRVLWAATRGAEPYPVAFAGPHGKGLRKLGLALSGAKDPDD